MKKIESYKKYLFNKCFDRTLFLTASYQVFENNMILMNDSLFSREKDSLQLDHIKFL